MGRLSVNMVSKEVEEIAAAQPQLVPAVSVVIVSYWTGPLLVRSVMSALQQKEVAEVIVVNNGNWDDAMERLQALVGDDVDRLKIISGFGNVGYAGGCNLGVKAASSKLVFILNPDAILPKDALAGLLAEGEALEGHWLLGGKLINPDGTEQAGSRRRLLTPWSAFVEMTKLYKFAPNHPYFMRFNRHQEKLPTETIATPVISGACMLMKRDTYLSIGGMDEYYFLHVEDVDFCLRLKEAGGEVYFAPNVDILHFKSSSRSSDIKVEIRKAQSMIRYFWSHFRLEYPWVFLVLTSIAVWATTGLKVCSIVAKRGLALIGLRARKNKKVAKRAKRISANRLSR